MPKFINTKKEKAAKTPVQKTKNAKAKKAKTKPAKAPKVKSKGLLPKNKRVLVLLVAAVMITIVGSAQAIILLTIKKKEAPKDQVQQPPSYYFTKDEDIASVTGILGERDFKKQSVEESVQATETKQADDQTQKASETSAVSSAQAAGEEDQYKYLHIEDTSADLKSYKDYLEGVKNFIEMTDKSQQEEQSSKEDLSKAGTEIYRLAGPSIDSASYLSITLESDADSYTVTTCKENQPWNKFFKDQWNQQKKKIADFDKQPKATNTIEQAEETVRAQSQEKLGLPETVDSYEYIASPGISKIDGSNYYTVRAYKRQPDRTLVYVATYLFDYNTSSVAYQYDEATGKAAPLS